MIFPRALAEKAGARVQLTLAVFENNFMPRKSVFLILFLLLLSPRPAAANPPLKLDLVFDAATQTLTATVIHLVNNPVTHYIFKIEVRLNDKLVIDRKLDRQTDDEQERIIFPFKDIKRGDRFLVGVYCNRSGSQTASITVE